MKNNCEFLSLFLFAALASCLLSSARGEDGFKFGGFLDDVKVSETPTQKAPNPGQPSLNQVPPTSTLNPDKITGSYKGLWKRNWYEIAKKMTVHDSYYFICAGYDRRYPSSRHKNLRQFVDEHKKAREQSLGAGLKKTVYITPDQTDARIFIESIPSVATGNYGIIYDGVIKQVLSEDRFVLDDIRLLDEKKLEAEIAAQEKKLKAFENRMDDQIDRLKRKQRDQERRESRYSSSSSSSSSRYTSRDRDSGLERSIDKASDAKREAVNKAEKDFEREFHFRQRLLNKKDIDGPIIVMATSTLGLSKGQRWPASAHKGISLAICGVYRSVKTDGKKGPSAPLAIPTEMLGRGLDENGFVSMLEAIDITPQQFVDELGELNKRYRDIDEARKLYARSIRTKLDKHRHDQLLAQKRQQQDES